MTKYLIAGIALLATVTSSLAQEYYVVRGPDRKCRVVESRPTETTIVQVGPLAFKTRDEADRQVSVLCKDDVVVEDRSRERVIIEKEVRR